MIVASQSADKVIQEQINVLGFRFQSYPIARNSLSPTKDLKTLLALRAIFKEVRPETTLAYTIKPIIWGGIAARSVPENRFFALVTGLGFAFQGTTLKRRLLNNLVIELYRFSLRNAQGVIFQNQDNLNIFTNRGIVPETKCHVVSGSGINIEQFSAVSLPNKPFSFLLIARLLGEKGIREYVQAARIVKSQFPDVNFDLVGPPDPSPDGIPINEVMSWNEEGVIRYLGATNDVRPFIENCHVYCLPSYHEGMPRTVLEAMAMGRPILTTEVSGCRETVLSGVNGFLVKHANVQELAKRMTWFIENQTQCSQMGLESRKLAESRFDVRKVNSEMLRIMGIGQK